MKEIDLTNRVDNRWKSVAIIAIASAVGLGAGYAYQISDNEELARALSAADSKIRLLTSLEKSLSTELSKLQTQLNFDGAELIKARDENIALSKKLKQNEETANTRQRRLQETIAAIQIDLAASIARANKLSKALDPETLSQVEGQKSSPLIDTAPGSSKMNNSSHTDLLEKFNRTSDDFTRPKVYLHAGLGSRLSSCTNKQRGCGRCTLLNLTVNTDGKLFFGGYKFTSIQVLHDDDVITYHKLEDFLESLTNRLSSVRNIRCRLKWEYHDFKRMSTLPVYGTDDINLDIDDINAFKDTLELANSYIYR
jgi:hypothetical protein